MIYLYVGSLIHNLKLSWRLNFSKMFSGLQPRRGGWMASKPTFQGPSESAPWWWRQRWSLKKMVYSLFSHLVWLLAWEYYTECRFSLQFLYSYKENLYCTPSPYSGQHYCCITSDGAAHSAVLSLAIKLLSLHWLVKYISLCCKFILNTVLCHDVLDY